MSVECRLNLSDRLHEPFPPQLIAEQIQRNGIDQVATALSAELMQTLPSADPGCCDIPQRDPKISTAHQKTSSSLESQDVGLSILIPDLLGATFV
jgi:hypothetical protein